MSNCDASSVSCGVYEVYNLQHQSPVDIIEEIFNEYTYRDDKGFPFAYAVFSDMVGKDRGGAKLAAYIRRHKLGEITRSTPAVNPNSQNTITVWVWRVDQSKMKSLSEKYWERIDKEDDF